MSCEAFDLEAAGNVYHSFFSCSAPSMANVHNWSICQMGKGSAENYPMLTFPSVPFHRPGHGQ